MSYFAFIQIVFYANLTSLINGLCFVQSTIVSYSLFNYEIKRPTLETNDYLYTSIIAGGPIII